MALKWRTHQSRDALGKISGSLETLWHIFSPLKPLFCVMNVSATKVSAWRSASVAVAAKILRPQLKAMSSRRKGVLSNLESVYSTRRRRNNQEIIIMSHPPLEEGVAQSI